MPALFYKLILRSSDKQLVVCSFHIIVDEVYKHLGSDIMLAVNLLPPFCRSLLPPSSW